MVSDKSRLSFHSTDIVNSRNCSKRGAKCEYPESVRPKESALDLPWISSASAAETSDKLEDATLAQQLSPYDLSSTDYRLMHHVLFVSGKLEASGSSKMAVWTGQIPAYLTPTLHPLCIANL